ncbi:biotin/lipoyl-binding protein [Acinetobacter sp. MB5]|uniref:HlyD family efflux transporter periplasmic adaptor subunit n=1 Tax=Acinetobacter sp. MB5 TaxID=2069438 RepID=UPI000DD04748|nr:biotin/lipoyl-binding protein [Acinetobacter sp. MB5]
MKKRFIIAILLIVLASAGYFFYLNKSQDTQQELTLYGNVDIRQISLAFENSGRIQSMNVEEGDRVQKGQVLAQLNTDALQIQEKQAQAQLMIQKQAILQQERGARPEEIVQAQAQVSATQAQLQKANQDLKRFSELSRTTAGQAISQQELDAAKNAQVAAEAQVKESQANLQLLIQGARQEVRAATKAQYQATQASLQLIQYQISQSKLISPSNAIVRAKLQESGDMTTAQKAVYTLALTNPKWVRVYLNEKELSAIKLGEKALVSQDTNPNQPITGQVGYISSVAEFTPKTVQTNDIRTTLVYEMRIYFQDPSDQLKMGQPVTVILKRFK